MPDLLSSPEHPDGFTDSLIHASSCGSAEVSDGFSVFVRGAALPDGCTELDTGHERADGLSKTEPKLADKILLRRYGASTEVRSDAIHSGSATASQFSDLSEPARQSGTELVVQSKNPS